MHKALTNPLITTVIIVAAVAVLSLIVMQITKPPDFSDDARVGVRIDQAKLRAGVAVTPEKLAKGLAGTEPLSDDRGLLLVYEEPAVPTIWMKGVSFPIDLVWISGDTVTQVTHAVPAAKPGVPDDELPRYRPDGPVDKVLETSAGWAKQHSIQPGDVVRFFR